MYRIKSSGPRMEPCGITEWSLVTIFKSNYAEGLLFNAFHLNSTCTKIHLFLQTRYLPLINLFLFFY